MKNKNTKFVMIAMFKNEANNILRMLKSCYKYFDYFIFQDNGSTDGTAQLVEDFIQEHNLNGFVYYVEEGWVGFGWNRDHLLQKCLNTDHGCDWIVKMDCDEYLEVDDDFDWSVFDDTSIHSFHVPAIAPGLTYYRAWIWNSKLPWKFNHDVAHETISLEIDGIGEDFQRVNLPLSFRQINTNDGESYTVPTKYVSDSLKLEEKLIRENTMLTDTYHFWYVGKSYFDAHACQTFPLGISQQKEYARRSIYYFEEFVNFTHPNYKDNKWPDRLDEFAYYAFVCVGNLYRWLGDYESSLIALNDAGNFCPERNEHLVAIAELYRDLGDYNNMLHILEPLFEESRKNPFPQFMFLIDNNCYYDSGSYLEELKAHALEGLSR